MTSGDELLSVAEEYLAPLREADVDTLVLGCTHYPFLKGAISYVMGEQVALVSSDVETANDVYRVLVSNGMERRVAAAPHLPLRGDGQLHERVPRPRAPAHRPRDPERRARRDGRAHHPPPRTASTGERMTEASDPQANLVRADGRAPDELRTVTFERGWSAHAEGSALVSFGNTKVLCTASFTNGVPRWMTGKGRGWVTAEYAMLPRSTNTRNDRESVKGRIGGRTHEISRLIGRSLRAVVDTKGLGENTIQIDCDVLQADGGTRTAAITGAYLALADAVEWAREQKFIGQKAKPLIDTVSAVSVGIIDGTPMLDLAYVEDVRAETDMNVVATGRGLFVEVQGTAEGAPFDRRELDALLDLALAGTTELTRLQVAALAAGAEAAGA